MAKVGNHSKVTNTSFYIDTLDLNALQDFIQTFGEQVQLGSPLRKALYAGGNFIRKASKRNLVSRMHNPKGVTGNLLKAYKVTVKPGNKGVLIGFNKYGHHAHLVDLGHEHKRGAVVSSKRTKGLLFHSQAKEQLPQAARIVYNTLCDELDNQYMNWARNYGMK